jgi:hypothetical protein
LIAWHRLSSAMGWTGGAHALVSQSLTPWLQFVASDARKPAPV